MLHRKVAMEEELIFNKIGQQLLMRLASDFETFYTS